MKIMNVFQKKMIKLLCIKTSVIVFFILTFLSYLSGPVSSESSSNVSRPLDVRIEYLESQVMNDSMISFKIPSCDPLSKTNLKTRSYSYDVAISAILFKMLARFEKSVGILSKLEGFISPVNGIDFSYDANDGPLGTRYVRSGAVAWLGYSFVYSNRLRSAQILANFLLTRRVSTPDDPRNGLFRGGFGKIKKNGFIEKEIEWISTEHNIDAYFLFRDLGVKLKIFHPQNASYYSSVARDLKTSILEKLWNSKESFFYRGINEKGIDKETPLDVQTWGALFLRAIGHEEKARLALKFAKKNFFLKNILVQKDLNDKTKFNCQYECASIPLMGFKPYLESSEYKKSPNLIWSEGTYGYSLAAKRLGIQDPELDISQKKLESCNLYGGVLQTTQTESNPPYEFHSWESTASTVWSLFYSLDSKFPERLRLWATDKSLGIIDNR
jgi:hypothetical protein